MAFDIAMDYSQIVHVEVNSGAVERHFDSNLHWYVHVSFHVQRCEQAAVNKFVNNYNIRNGWTAAHQ